MRRMVPALPIIVSSGYDQQEDSATLADQGAVVFLEKPYSPHDLTAKVGLLLDTARR
jgi:DNA-binding response OmpR family regulator